MSDRASEPSGGWTGGQLSLLRVGAGLAVAFLAAPLARSIGPAFASPAAAPLLAAVAVVIGLLLAAGIASRPSATLAITIAAGTIAGPYVTAAPLTRVGGTIDLVWPLLLIALAPPRPFGSWPARGRPDPAGGWSLPPAVVAAGRVVLVARYAASGAARVAGLDTLVGLGGWPVAAQLEPALVVGFLELGAALALANPASRRIAWWIALTAGVALALATGDPAAALALALFHLATCEPAWWPGRRRVPGHLFYDQDCGLCQASVRFVLAEGPGDASLRLAPLGGETFERLLPPERRERLPDSLVLVEEGGAPELRSVAAIRLLERIGGVWGWLGAVLRLVPRPLRDAVYDVVARLRHRIFPPPESVGCPVTPPELRRRFDP